MQVNQSMSAPTDRFCGSNMCVGFTGAGAAISLVALCLISGLSTRARSVIFAAVPLPASLAFAALARGLYTEIQVNKMAAATDEEVVQSLQQEALAHCKPGLVAAAAVRLETMK